MNGDKRHSMSIRERIRKDKFLDSEEIANAPKKSEGKFCKNPFDQFEIHPDGTVSVCCMSWLPEKIGNAEEKEIGEIFNSKKAQDIRESILDGSFKYCDHKLCPYIQNGSLPDREEVEDPRHKSIIEKNQTKDLEPTFYNLCYDESCNLSCPSCRINKIFYYEGKVYEAKKKIQDKLIAHIFGKPHDNYCLINVTGSGDPFGSKLFRELLFSIDGEKFPRVFFNLQTNGVMFTPRYWDKIKRIQKNINTVIVSYDAGTPETYRITRRGGNWDRLQENMKFLSSLRQRGLIKELRIDCVVQKANYKELDKLIKIGLNLKVDKIFFSLLVDWGTWSPEVYKQNCVWKKTNPKFDDFKETLRNPIFDNPIVDLGNLTEYRNVSIQ
jgi:MoaA/NifB/PqqE/SkfB family radical SAM enzyme